MPRRRQHRAASPAGLQPRLSPVPRPRRPSPGRLPLPPPCLSLLLPPRRLGRRGSEPPRSRTKGVLCEENEPAEPHGSPCHASPRRSHDPAAVPTLSGRLSWPPPILGGSPRVAWLPSYTPTPPPFGPFSSPGADKARLCRRCGSAAGEISACSFKMLRAAQILLREPGGEGGGEASQKHQVRRGGGERGLDPVGETGGPSPRSCLELVCALLGLLLPLPGQIHLKNPSATSLELKS